MSISISEDSEDTGNTFVITSSSEASHVSTLKRSLTSYTSDDDSIAESFSPVKRTRLSPGESKCSYAPSDSDSDPVFLSDSCESDTNSTGEVFMSDTEQQPATMKPVDHDLEEVASLLISACCDRKCMHFLTVNDVVTARDKVNSLSSNALRQWTIDRINENSHEEASGKIRTKYLVAGNEVCSVHAISPARFARLKKSVIKGQKEFEHGNKGKKRFNTRTEGAKAWMTRYFHLIGDKMPHKNQIHLPSWETQKDIYTRYKSDMELQQIPESEMVALSSFFRIWTDEFPMLLFQR